MNFFKNKTKTLIIDIFICFISIISSVYIAFSKVSRGYEYLFTQPLLFMLVYLIVYRRVQIKKKMNLFLYVFFFIIIIRYVLLPFLIVYTDYFGGRSSLPPDKKSFLIAVFLMNYELVLCSILIYFKTGGKSIRTNTMQLSKNTNIVYYLFGLVTLFTIIRNPKVLLAINFIVPNFFSVFEEVEYTIIENMLIYAFIIFKQLLFLILTQKLYFRYIKTNKKKYLSFNFILALLNILIYFGTNRSDLLITAIVSLVTLSKLYGRIVNKYIVIVFLIISVVITVVSVHRNTASISKGQNRLVDITDAFGAYSGSAYNIAIAIETKKMYPESKKIKTLLFDIFRPMIGVNIFIKNLDIKYSNIYFNQRIWRHVDRRSQILPMIGQGNLFFGYLFSPILSLFFVNIVFLLNKIKESSKSLELSYFLSLSIVRMGFFMGQNTMNMINDMSMNLVLFSFVYAGHLFVNRLKDDLRKLNNKGNQYDSRVQK